MLPLRMERVPDGGRLIAAPTRMQGRSRSPRRGRSQTGPPRIRTGSVGSANPGAEIKSHQFQFFLTQAPSGAGRNGTQALLILRAGKILPAPRGNPRNGVRGKATMSTKCSSGAVPGGVLPSFSPWKKKVAARRRRNPPRSKYKRRRRGHPPALPGYGTTREVTKLPLRRKEN